MNQNLPLNYPQILTMFLEQRVKTVKEKFDEIVFNNVHFEFEIYEESQLVRVKDLTNKITYNISCHDSLADYQGVETLVALLNYAEHAIEFTIHDWVVSFLNGANLYSGAIIDIITQTKNKTVVSVKGRDITYVIDGDKVWLATGLKYSTDKDNGQVCVVSAEPRDEINNEEYYNHTESLLYLFNSEYALYNVTVWDKSIIVTSDSVFENKEPIDVFGIKVTVGSLESKTIHFDFNGFNYFINTTGHVSVTKNQVKELNIRPGVNYSNTVYMRFTMPHELALARAVVNILNSTFY